MNERFKPGRHQLHSLRWQYAAHFSGLAFHHTRVGYKAVERNYCSESGKQTEEREKGRSGREGREVVLARPLPSAHQDRPLTRQSAPTHSPSSTVSGSSQTI